MGIPSGLSAQLMTAEESVYGTAVTTDRGFEFRGAPLKLDIERIESKAIRSGQRVQRSDRYAPGKKSVAGNVIMELGNKGYGRWLKHMLGGVATSQPDSVGNPTVYKHTFTLGDMPVGQTIQVGRPDDTGTVRPFTYSGCKVQSWKIACAVGEFVTLEAGILGQNEDTATSLAVISYPAGIVPMTFVGGTVTVGGSNMDVKSAGLDASNMLAEDRYFMGSALRKNPLEANLRTFTGKLEPEFESLTAYNRFVNATEAALVLLFQGAIISTTYHYECKITMNVRFDGDTPDASDMGIVQNPLSYKVVDDGTNSIKIEYQTTDTTP